MPSDVAIIAPTLPAHLACYQALINEGVGKAVVQLDTTGFTNILKQSTTPSATQRNYLWFNTNDDRTYRWDATIGAWVIRHEISPGNNDRRLWVGTTTQLETYDGGASGTVGDAAGPMWEVDTGPAAKFLIGVGSLPSGTAIAVRGTGGNETVTLEVENLPEIDKLEESLTDPGIANNFFSQSQTTFGTGAVDVDSDAPWIKRTTQGEEEAFTIVPPYFGIYVIKRTARVYRTA